MAVAEKVGRAAQIEPVARRRDSRLAEDLFTEHSRRIYAYCLRQLGSREEAEDALQATYLNACRSLRRGFEPEVAQAWLIKVAQNVCITRLRSTSRRARLERPQDLEAVQDVVAAPQASGEELFGLEDALVALPEQQRRAILLREWQGLSYREVAAELGLTQSAVETLIFRARRSLAAALEEPPARSRRRILHSFDLGALLAGLKSSLAGSLSANVATSIAVAASATIIASGPVGREAFPPAPLAERPAAKVAAEERPPAPTASGRFALRWVGLERLAVADSRGRGAEKGQGGGRSAKAHRSARGQKTEVPGRAVRAHGRPAAKPAPPGWGRSQAQGQSRVKKEK